MASLDGLAHLVTRPFAGRTLPLATGLFQNFIQNRLSNTLRHALGSRGATKIILNLAAVT